MAGSSGFVSALAEVLVRIEVAHLVSSSSMVSRAYLVDNCVGVVVDAGESGYWLASALSALAPDPDGLRVRAAEKGGIPVESSTPRLVKITLAWDDSTVELKNPAVVAGSGIGVVSLAVPASLSEKIRKGEGPHPIALATDAASGFGQDVGVMTLSDGWPMVRWGRISSEPGFGGIPGGQAMDVGLPIGGEGAPVFAFGEAEPWFCGLAQPRDAATSILLPQAVIGAAIPSDP